MRIAANAHESECQKLSVQPEWGIVPWSDPLRLGTLNGRFLKKKHKYKVASKRVPENGMVTTWASDPGHLN